MTTTQKGLRMSRFTHSTSISTAQVRRFARHYLEMVIAMFAGMVLLPAAALWLVRSATARRGAQTRS